MVFRDIYGQKLREVSEYNSKKIELFLEKLKPKLLSLYKDLEAHPNYSKQTSPYCGFVLKEYWDTCFAFPYLDEKVRVSVEFYENHLRVSVGQLSQLGNKTYLFVVLINPNTEDISCTWYDSKVMASYFGLKTLDVDNWHMLTVTDTYDSTLVKQNQENFLSLFELKSTD